MYFYNLKVTTKLKSIDKVLGNLHRVPYNTYSLFKTPHQINTKVINQVMHKSLQMKKILLLTMIFMLSSSIFAMPHFVLMAKAGKIAGATAARGEYCYRVYNNHYELGQSLQSKGTSLSDAQNFVMNGYKQAVLNEIRSINYKVVDEISYFDVEGLLSDFSRYPPTNYNELKKALIQNMGLSATLGYELNIEDIFNNLMDISLLAACKYYGFENGYYEK